MHWQTDKFVVSQYEHSTNHVHCPNCSAQVTSTVSEDDAFLICSGCDFKVNASSVEGLPDSLVSAILEARANHVDIEAMKAVVDELHVRGSVAIADELNNIIVASVASEQVVQAERVEGLRLLNFVQAQAEQEPNLRHLAARLAMLKSDLTRRK